MPVNQERSPPKIHTFVEQIETSETPENEYFNPFERNDNPDDAGHENTGTSVPPSPAISNLSSNESPAALHHHIPGHKRSALLHPMRLFSGMVGASQSHDPLASPIIALSEAPSTTSSKRRSLFPKFTVNRISYVTMLFRSYRVFIAAFIASMGVFQWGYNISSVASAMDAISKCQPSADDGFFKKCIPMDQMQWSLAVSMMILGGVVGALCMPTLSDTISRYWSFVWLNLFNIVGCSMQILFSEIWTFYVGRFLVGIAAGGVYGVTGIYLAEIAPDSIRGLVSGIYGICVCFGLLVSSFLGIFLSFESPGWRILIGINAAVSIVNLILLPYCRESPRWLIMKKKFDEARISLKFFRRSKSLDDPLILEEIKVVSESLQSTGKKNIFKSIFRRSMIRPTVVNLVLSTAGQLVGTYMILSYSVLIFERAGLGENAQVWSTLVTGSNWLGAIVAAFMFDRFGRRPQIILAQVMITVAMLVLTVSFALIDVHVTFAILCIACMMIIVVSYAIGVGGGSVLVVVEMHPIHLRGLAMSLGAFLNWTTFFIMAMLFPLYSDFMKGYTFIPFTVYNAALLVFCILFVRETKGRSIDLVQIDKKSHEERAEVNADKKSVIPLLTQPEGQYAELHNVPSMDSVDQRGSTLHSDLNVSTDSMLVDEAEVPGVVVTNDDAEQECVDIEVQQHDGAE